MPWLRRTRQTLTRPIHGSALLSRRERLRQSMFLPQAFLNDLLHRLPLFVWRFDLWRRSRRWRSNDRSACGRNNRRP